jgi:hypothetical protein
MLAKNGDHSLLQTAPLEHARNLICELKQPSPARAQHEMLLKNRHRLSQSPPVP